MRITSRRSGRFSQRDTVGCEHKSAPLSGQPPASQLETWIDPQVIEVVGILVAAGDSQHAGTQDIGATLWQIEQFGLRGSLIRAASLAAMPIDFSTAAEQHDAAIGGHSTAIKRRSDFLAPHRWQRKR